MAVSAIDEVADAIDDILSVLPVLPDHDAAEVEKWQPSIWIDLRGRLRPFAPDAAGSNMAEQPLRTGLASMGAAPGPVAFAVVDNDLIVRVAAPTDGGTAFVARIGDQSLASFLETQFPGLRLPTALRHLLRLHLAGFGLKDGAARDGRSAETRKRQSQQLRAAFDAEDLATVGRLVAAALALALDRHVRQQVLTLGRGLQDYVARMMPSGPRLLGLASATGGSVPVIDMGPADGRPVLVLHPMALPDLRPVDIAALNRLRLRLVWPLRHGLCDPGAVPLPPYEHLRHAVRGARLALNTMCGGSAPVLAFAAASRVGLELAADAPESVLALHVAGVCVRKGRPETGARRLARGVLALAARNPGLLDPILTQIEMRLRRPGVFEEFIRRQFADSSADLAVIEADLAGPRGADRFRTALLDSAASARHDFLFQTDLGWDRVPPDLCLHLHHGAQDSIHPLPLIEDLCAGLPGARLHVHPRAGQLFHHDHLIALLEHIAVGGVLR